MRIISDAKTGVVLGVQIVGPEASDLISEAALAIEMGATIEDLALTIHPHPTLPEAIMEAAESAAGQAHPPAETMRVSLLDLGRRPYPEVWELQKRLWSRRGRGGEVEDTLILVEHDHVITLGRKTTPENFKPQDIPVFQVERGGDATYHGPDSSSATRSSRWRSQTSGGFVRSLEEVLIIAVQTASRWKPAARRTTPGSGSERRSSPRSASP